MFRPLVIWGFVVILRILWTKLVQWYCVCAEVMKLTICKIMFTFFARRTVLTAITNCELIELLVGSVSKCLEFRWTAGCNFTTKLITLRLTVWSHWVWSMTLRLCTVPQCCQMQYAYVVWNAITLIRLNSTSSKNSAALFYSRSIRRFVIGTSDNRYEEILGFHL